MSPGSLERMKCVIKTVELRFIFCLIKLFPISSAHRKNACIREFLRKKIKQQNIILDL